MTSTLHYIRDLAIGRAAAFTRAEESVRGDGVLIIQPDHLGDILMSQPAVREIRRRFKGKRLIAVVGPWSEVIARRTWNVDEVITFPFPGFDRSRTAHNALEPYRMLAGAAQILRRTHAGTAFILRPDDWWSAWLASMVTSGAIITARAPRMDPFATAQIDLSAHVHAVQRALALASERDDAGTLVDWTPAMAPLSMPFGDVAHAIARQKLSAAGVEGDFVVIHPGAGADVKTWPTHRWRAVVEDMTASGHTVVVTGSQSERPHAEQVSSGISQAFCLAGETSLDELVEVLRLASVVAGPDSGPLHLAVACQTPTVHLFGPSECEKFGPWGPSERHMVVSAGWHCNRCGDLSPSRSAGCGCMLAIDVHPVIKAIKEMLARHATD